MHFYDVNKKKEKKPTHCVVQISLSKIYEIIVKYDMIENKYVHVMENYKFRTLKVILTS